MSVDINLIEFNQSFLKKLQSDRNVSVSDIKLKFKGFLKPSTYTKLYRVLDSITNTHPDIKLSSQQKKCLYGDISQIEEVVITNKNFPFFNEFHVYNITGTIRIVDKVRFNGLNKNFYIDEIQRYKKLLISVFTKYISSWTEYKKRMDEYYVVGCYVDKYYNGPDDITQDFTQDSVTYPDLFIDAGPDLSVSRSTKQRGPLAPEDSADFDITGATNAYFNGATYLWEIGPRPGLPPILSSSDAIIVPGTENQLEPKVRELGSPAAPLSSNFFQSYQLTLTVTYPWGPVISDKRIISFTGDYIYAGYA